MLRRIRDRPRSAVYSTMNTYVLSCEYEVKLLRGTFRGRVDLVAAFVELERVAVFTLGHDVPVTRRGRVRARAKRGRSRSAVPRSTTSS